MSEKGKDTAPPRRSAALSYSGEGAPVLVARGERETARRILALAEEHGVPIMQDEQLTAILCQLPLGDEIPPSLYAAVAEVLAYVYRLNDRVDDRV